MDYGLILAVVAIVVTIVVAWYRSQGSTKQRKLMEEQLQHQKEELRVLCELVESFNRLTTSYDAELESMRTQLQLTSGDAGEAGEPGDQVAIAAEIELEREKQKAEKKRQKEEVKSIKKMMKALEKEQRAKEG